MVYFIQRESDNAIKIGCTRNLIKRIKHYKDVKILKHIKGSFKIEKEIHKKFQHLNIEGEWFKNDNNLLSYIDQLENCIVNSDIETDNNLHTFMNNVTITINTTRKSKQISISQLSELANVPIASIYKIERNEYDVSFFNILKILDTLNLLNLVFNVEQKLISNELNIENKTYNSIKLDAELELVTQTLQKTNYDKKSAAKFLNISIQRLNNILNRNTNIDTDIINNEKFAEKTNIIKISNVIQILQNNSYNKYKTSKILDIPIKKINHYINAITDQELKQKIKELTT